MACTYFYVYVTMVKIKLPAIRNIKYRYGITGDSANIFRREKIVSAEEKRIC